MLARILLGLFSLPLAALLYVASQWLTPRILEPSPIAMGEGRERAPTHPNLLITKVRASIAVIALAVLAVALWKAIPAPSKGLAGQTAAPAAPAQQLQLPPAVPLQTLARFGSDGAGPAQLHDARDLAVDPNGNIWVADTGNRRLIEFKPDGSPLGQWTDSAQGPLVEPSALVAVQDGIVVLDSEAARLHKFDFNGRPVPGFEQDLRLAHPRGLAVDPKGLLYIASTASNTVVKAGPTGAAAGDIPNFDQPASLTVDDQGALYVGQPDTGRLDKLGPDGALQARWVSPRSTTVLPPRLLAIPGKGLLATAPGENLLVQYDPTGKPVASWTPSPSDGPAPQRPLGLALAPDGKSIWVLWNATSAITQLALPA